MSEEYALGKGHENHVVHIVGLEIFIGHKSGCQLSKEFLEGKSFPLFKQNSVEFCLESISGLSFQSLNVPQKQIPFIDRNTL